MGYMTKQEYEEALWKIRRKNQQKLRKQKLKEEKNKYKQKKKLPSTSKLILIGAVLLCLQIVIFSECVMWKTNDLTALYALIGISSSLSAVVIAYYVKSKAENTSGGLIYESAMEKLRHADNSVCEQINDEEDTEICG